MNISVFLSYPQPHLKKQEDFINAIKKELSNRGFCARTLGVTDYDVDEPLVAIRRLMLESNGILTVAFKRTQIKNGIIRPNREIGGETCSIDDEWLTSPYCQIEPAMAFQIGLPILIFREQGVIQDGILEKGVIGTYLPEFDLDETIEEYFSKQEWKQLIDKWDRYVKNVYEQKGKAPRLY